MKVYISGAITNNPEAKQQFDDAKQTLLDLKKDYQPISPMDLPHKHDLTWQSFMREDIKALMDCDGIYLIEGWQRSIGARIEKDLAESLNMKIIYELKV